VLAELRDFSVVGDFVAVPYYELRRVLNELLKIEQRFESGDFFAEYLKGFFSDWFVFFNTSYAWKQGIQIWQLLDDWARNELPKFKYYFQADCDDFARAFAATTALKTGVNAVLTVLGVVEHDGAQFGHAWNALVPIYLHGEPGSYEAYASIVFVEPQIPLSGLPDSDGVWRPKLKSGLLSSYTVEYKPYAVLG